MKRIETTNWENEMRSAMALTLAAVAALAPLSQASGQTPTRTSAPRRAETSKPSASPAPAATAPVTAAPPAAPSRSQVEVSLYGMANAGLDNYSATGATSGDKFPLRQRVFSSGSRLGVRGGLDVGSGGLRAVFQIESGLNLDNGATTGQGGTSNPSVALLSSRASFVGLEGDFGRVLVGRQDVYWFNGTVEQTAENYISTGLPWMSGGNTGKAAIGIALQSNVVSYMTPKLGKSGRVTLYFSPDAGPSLGFVNSESAAANQKTNARLFAATGTWSSGSLVANVDLAYKKGSSDSPSSGPAGFQDVPSNRGLKLGLAWKYQAGSQLSAIVSQVSTTNYGADTRLDYSAKYVSLNWEQLRGQWQLLGQVGKAFGLSGCAGAVSANCTDTGAIGLLASARYIFSKEVSAYAFFTQVSNQAGSFHDYTDYRYSSASGVQSRNLGADPRIFGIGMRFSFDALLASSSGSK
jgi:predicted porin